MKRLEIQILFTVVLVSLGAIRGGPIETRTNKDFLTCLLCSQVVNTAFNAFEAGTPEVVIDEVVSICNQFNIYTEQVCRGTAEKALPVIEYIYNTTGIIQGNVCGILLPTSGCTLSDPESLEWSIPPSSVPKPPSNELSKPPQGSPTLKVLHIADVHWDPEYAEGSNSICNEPLCCRVNSTGSFQPENAAGYWGSYGDCDIPLRTFENAVAHMGQQHSDADYIIWTGDLVPHDVWSTDKAENLLIIDRLMDLMRTYFPNTPIYPTLGNHESSPVNVFSPPGITDEEHSMAWLYEEAERQWMKWLPNEASNTIRYGGFYTALIKPGLRIISMNMNYCYTLNYWTFSTSKDPASGLTWMSQILQSAEDNQEKVHIISHIPPGNDDCWTIFSREYAKLIFRYESTVAAQFFGHTHKEQFKISYDVEGVEANPINVAFVGGSITTYSNLNPSYRVYTVDGQRQDSTFAVLDYSTWIMNLTAANANKAVDPVWFELYQARSTYGLDDLSPSQMEALLERMILSDDLFQQYYRNFVKGSEVAYGQGCYEACKENLLCNIVTNNVWDQSRCDAIKQRISRQ